MKLWILKPQTITRNRDNPWHVNWDCAIGFVVAAETEAEARMLAQKSGGDETNHEKQNFDKTFPAWLESKYSTCEELTASNVTAGVVMCDFNAG
jgi:hypothetical protein